MTASPADLRARAQTASGHLPALILSAERLAAMIAPGAHGLRRGGPGEDFWQYRPAGPGDTARSIDWRRSARSDATFVRERELHTAQSAILWVAGTPGMDWTGDPSRPTKRARAELLALALAHGVRDEDQVWAAAHVDEDWNIEKWGVDEEVAARRAARQVDFKAAAGILREFRPAAG